MLIDGAMAVGAVMIVLVDVVDVNFVVYDSVLVRGLAVEEHC